MAQERSQGMMKVPRIKNYAPAEIQVTAEQLLRESIYYRLDEHKPARIKITDPDELEEYKYRVRKDYEDSLRRQKHHMGTWLKYAEWEASIGEYTRARSVFERAIGIDFEHVTLWLKYAEMEMRNKFVQHARNVWERACKHLPRVDQFWYKYALMEEMLGNKAETRQIFEDWMTWKPQENAWNAFIKFELRNGELDKCRDILERYIDTYPGPTSYVKAANFEEHQKCHDKARLMYERALAELGKLSFQESFFISFTKFEIRLREYERAKILFEYALESIQPKDSCKNLAEQYIAFQKQFGTRDEVEDVVLTQRRQYFEGKIQDDLHNYELWFDYCNLEEQAADSPQKIERTRAVYERAVVNLPPATDKRFWQRYIYLWINFALFEESSANDRERATKVYEKILSLIPHETFTFAKVWIIYANFLVRGLELQRARKVFGMALGKCPRPKIFKAYAELELNLGEMDRCRTIYEKFVSTFGANTSAWIEYGQFEADRQEPERARAIFNIAINSEQLDQPEAVWKAYIDFETEQGSAENARNLYEQLLQRTKHVKVWISYARSESTDITLARSVFERGNTFFRENQAEGKEERLMLLENWLDVEEGAESDFVDQVRKKFPKRVKKRRKVKIVSAEQNKEAEESQAQQEEKPADEGWEEYYDYIFPEDEAASGAGRNMKLLQMAAKWKQNAAKI